MRFNNTEKFNSEPKLKELIKRKQKELDVYVIEVFKDNDHNAHLLCKDELLGTYTVWTSYYSDECKIAYNGFYSGVYNLDLREALGVLCHRSKSESIYLAHC